jgi:Xaa-Pro aminopeptidase
VKPFDPAEYGTRLRKAQSRLEDHGLDHVLVGPGADLRYLTGYDAPALTRLTALLISRDRVGLLLPELEVQRAAAAPIPDAVELRRHRETEDAVGLLAASLGPGSAVGVGDRFWARFLIPLQQQAEDCDWMPAERLMSGLRRVKSASEVARLRAAGRAIDDVHAQVPALLRAGRTEHEVARDIANLITDAGHDEVNFVIVGSGPNGASPHHESSDRRLKIGDAVVVDIGGRVEGYCSDCTRNYVVGQARAAVHDTHAVLKAAQQAAVESVRPGRTASEIDQVARQAITEAGHGERFLHRTGHGIGLDEHEEPYIVAGNDTVLEEGMAFSIEPGIYFEGDFGLRLEDIVVVTSEGVESLNRAPHDLVTADPGNGPPS